MLHKMEQNLSLLFKEGYLYVESISLEPIIFQAQTPMCWTYKNVLSKKHG